MATDAKTILVADDDPDVLNYLETALLCDGFRVITAQDGVEAVNLVGERGGIAAAIIDLMMPRKDGFETLRAVREKVSDLPVVILSGTTQPTTIVDAMKAGATDYLTKPVDHEKLLDVMKRVTAAEGGATVTPPTVTGSERGFLYTHPRMKKIQRSLAKLAPWNVPVLLLGESGVGKEVLARELHRLSPRSKKPLVKINCVALPSELLESELFGYEKGAFTGAFRAKPGKFEMADGGTILLDEIGDMDLKLQAKLLQVLQDGEFHRLGGRDAVTVDVRLVVATHRDLEKGIAEGWFREDLYYRLSVVRIPVPSLRQRREEILPLAQHFLEKHGLPDMAAPEVPLTLRKVLVDYDWPGNVRELENVMRKLLVFGDADMIIADLHARGERRSRNGAFARVAGAASPLESNQNRATAVDLPAEPAAWSGLPDQHGVPDVRELDDTPPSSAQAAGSFRDNHSARATAGTMYAPAVAVPPQPQSPPRNAPDPPERSEPAALAQAPFTESVQEAAVKGSQQVGDWSQRFEELERLITALLPASNGKAAGPDDAAPDQTSSPNAADREDVLPLEKVDEEAREQERQAILAALSRTNWNRRKAAGLLEVDYKGLLYRMKKLGIGQPSDGEED